MVAAAVVCCPRAARAQIQPAGVTSYGLSSAATFHDLIHNLVILFSGRPFNTQAEIDRLIGNGDPWRLLPETQAKLVTLQPRLRLRLFGLIAERFASVRLLGMDGSFERDQPLNASPWVLQLSGQQSNELLNPFIDTAVTHFTDVQLIDLITATVFHLPFLPRSQSGWRALERDIDRYDIWLGVGVALIGALANEGTFQIAGQFLTTSDGTSGVGWYAGTNKLGIRFNPILRGGLSLLTSTMQVQAGLIGQINAPSNSEEAAVEAQMKQHFIRYFGRPVGWEFVFVQRGHYVLAHTAPRAPHVIAAVDFYARRPSVFDDPDLNLQLGLSAGSDFLDGLTTTQTVGLDKESFASSLVFQITESVDLHGGPTRFRAGIFAGGALESARRHDQHEVFRLAGRVREVLSTVNATRARLNDLRLALEADRPLDLDAAGEDRETRALRREYRLLAAQRAQLGRSLAYYLASRRQYYELLDHDATALTDEDGVLEPDVLDGARRELSGTGE